MTKWEGERTANILLMLMWVVAVVMTLLFIVSMKKVQYEHSQEIKNNMEGGRGTGEFRNEKLHAHTGKGSTEVPDGGECGSTGERRENNVRSECTSPNSIDILGLRSGGGD